MPQERLRLDPIPGLTAADWRRLVRARWSRAIATLRATWPRVLLGAIVGVGIALLLAFLAPAPLSTGGPVRGGLAWFVLTAIVTSLTTRLAMVGPRQSWEDVRGFPGRIVTLVRDDGSAAAVHVLLGFAAGTLITWLLGPALGGLLGIGLFLALGTMLRSIIVGGAMVAWRWLVTRLAPRNPAATPLDATAVSLLGASGAMALALAVPSVTARLAIGLLAVVVALLLRGRTGRSDVLTVALVVAIAALGGAIVIDATGGFESPDMLWLLAGGFALGVLLTASSLSLSVVIGAFRRGSSGLAGAALGAVVGSLVGLIGLLVGLPAIPVALAVALAALLLVPWLATGLGGLIGRGTSILTGDASAGSGIRLAALAALTAFLIGLTNSLVGVAALILSVVVLVLARWGPRALSSTAVLVLVLLAIGAPAFAQQSPAPFETLADGIRQLEVEVRADQPITDTRFDVLAGETLHLKASGAVRLIAGDERSVVDADGQPARYGGCELGLYCGTLTASFRPDGLSRFGIGSETLLPPAAAGRLYLSVNDADPTDNAGSFLVTIRAGPAGALGVVLPTPQGVSREAVSSGDAAESTPSSLASGDAGSGGAPAIELLAAAGLAAAGAIAGILLVRRGAWSP